MKRTALGVGAKSLERGSTFRRATSPTDFRDGNGQFVNPPPLRRVVILGDRANKPRRPQVPRLARDEALARSDGRCILCPRPAVQVHHCLPKGKFPHLAKRADNLVGMCVGCHANHESAYRRIPHHKLPAVTVALAEAEGLSWYVERVYPVEDAA